MSDEQNNPEEVVYTFEKSDGYRVIPVDGGWGGVTTNKIIRLELFTEAPIWTEKVRFKLNGNLLGAEIDRSPKESRDVVQIRREIHTAIVMTPAVAKSIAEWLLKRCEEAGSK